MRHQVHGKKLNRSSGHRKALYRNLAQSVIMHERVTTTLVKAKAVKPVVEKLITRAKDQDIPARRAVAAFLPTDDASDKLFHVLAPRFADRPGGYTRVVKIGRRLGDGAEMAVLELVELSTPATVQSAASRSPEDSKPARSTSSQRKRTGKSSTKNVAETDESGETKS